MDKQAVIKRLYGVAGLFLLSFSVIYWSKEISDVGLFGALSISSLVFNVVMILIMLFTIHSSKKDINRQIESYKKSSDSQITAIKTLTESQIEQANIAKRGKNYIDILTLRKEIELNYNFIVSNIKDKDNHSKGISYILSLFKTSAYEQGMVTSYLTDEELIDKILEFYANLSSANELIKMTINLNITILINKREIIANANKNIIAICEKNVDRAAYVIEKLRRAESELKK